jgi:hypothetical protein
VTLRVRNRQRRTPDGARETTKVRSVAVSLCISRSLFFHYSEDISADDTELRHMLIEPPVTEHFDDDIVSLSHQGEMHLPDGANHALYPPMVE